MPLILDRISYIYNPGTAFEKKALNQISLKIEDGEFIGLIGHTGSGKSTLIQHLNGLLKATEGSIYFNGEDIYDKDYDLKSLRLKVGLVFQYPEHQLFESTVLKDVQFGPKNQGLSKLEVDLRAYEALKQVGIGDELLDASPFELSGGQKRRAAIAGVLAMKPQVLILDEPTAGLDPKGRDEILDQISVLHEKTGVTVILVSHSMEDIGRYAGRLIVMNEGEVALDGKPGEIFSYYRELEQIGLCAPQVTYVMEGLRSCGYQGGKPALTVGEAKKEILNWARERKLL